MRFIAALKKRWVGWVWNHTPTCAEISRLASFSFDQPFSLKVQFKMHLHYLICVGCERYYKHLRFLHRAAPEMSDHLDKASSRQLSVEAKQRMVQRLHAAVGH